MNTDVVLSGMSTVPSDYTCKDGQLYMSVNCLAEGQGEIHNLSKPQKVMGIPDSYTFLYVHETSYYKNYIFAEKIKDNSYNYYFVDADDGDLKFQKFLSSTYSCKQVNAIGNTLVLFLQGEIHYFLFKNPSYKDLGNSLPELNLQFGLIGEPAFYSKLEGEDGGRNIHFDFEVWPNDKKTVYKSEDLRSYVDLVMAPINLLIKEQVTDKGMFCFPFFVRYALRLYDGTLVHHSAPILMYCASNDGVFPFFRKTWYSGSKLTDCNVDVFLIRSQLTYKVLDDVFSSKFTETWKDIVKSVDIFISSPIYTFNDDGTVDDLATIKFKDTDYMKNRFVGKIKDGSFKSDNVNAVSAYNNYAAFKFLDLFNCAADGMTYDKDTTSYPVPVIVPTYSDAEMKKKIESTSSFFLFKSITLNELENARSNSVNGKDNVIEVEKGYLSSLVNHEAMSDEYHTHDILNAGVSYVYNKRLNIAEVSRSLYDGYPIKTMFPRYGGDIACTYNETSGKYIFGNIVNNIKQNAFTATVEDGDKSIKLYTETDSTFFVSGNDRIPTYFFYPNTGLKEVVWWRNFKTFAKLDAQMHDFLNVGFAVLYSDNLGDYQFSNGSLSQSKGDKNKLVSEGSNIYTSSVNNPFYFPSSGINEVGIGKVFSMAAAVKALSEGQFGQFPLYAFTSNGVWALSVGSDGSYTTVTPVSRDVCISTQSICSLDSSVVFATRRGIMMLSGSNAECITDSLKDSLSNAYGSIDLQPVFSLAGVSEPRDIHFLDFLENSGIIYDYPHQRIIVYNDMNTDSYVYSLQTRAWGLTQTDVVNSVNSYPDALAIVRDGDSMTLSDLSKDGAILKGVVITRPFKINEAHVMCAIKHLLLRGNIDYKSNVKMALFGTRDYRNYVCVSSSKTSEMYDIYGSPYKAYVLAIISNIEDYESFYGFSLDYTPRLNNRIR